MHHPNLSRASRWVNEEIILPLTNVDRGTPNPNGVTSTSCVQEPRMLCEGLDPKYIGKMANRRLEPVCLYECDVECHYYTVRVWGELERDHVEELEYLVNKWMKRKGDPCL